MKGSKLRHHALALLVAALLAGCRPSINPQDFPTLQLQSASIVGEKIPWVATCDGQSASPKFSWIAPPEGTKSLALLGIDRDSPFDYQFVHWVVTTFRRRRETSRRPCRHRRCSPMDRGRA